jgi:hypothetical protein
MKIALVSADIQEMKSVSMILAQEIEDVDTLEERRRSILQLACDARCVELVEYRVNRGSCTESTIHDRGTALYDIIEYTVYACACGPLPFIVRRLHESIFQLILLLVHH